MFQNIKRKLKKLFFNRLAFKFARLLLNILDVTITQQNAKNLTMGDKSRLYPEARVINMQNDASKITLGENTHIRGILLILPYGKGIHIGSNCYVGDHSRIWAYDSVVIGNSVLISHNVTIIDSDSHEIDFIEREQSFIHIVTKGHPKNKGNLRTAPIIIKDHAWISYNVSILKGVIIGEGAIVGAGSVVTHDVPAWSIAAGNPAKIKKRLINTIRNVR
jgi:acetyltransferase-like isoleucine patch superfamily enzyme